MVSRSRALFVIFEPRMNLFEYKYDHHLSLSGPGTYFSKVPRLFGPTSGVTIPFIGSFSIDNGNGNDNATNKKFDW